MNKVVRPWRGWRGTAASPPPERKDSLMMDDDRISTALPEGSESKGEGGPESRTRAAVSAGRADGSPAYPELFEPISIGGCTIRNRIVMAPMNVLMTQGNTGYETDQ